MGASHVSMARCRVVSSFRAGHDARSHWHHRRALLECVVRVPRCEAPHEPRCPLHSSVFAWRPFPRALVKVHPVARFGICATDNEVAAATSPWHTPLARVVSLAGACCVLAACVFEAERKALLRVSWSCSDITVTITAQLQLRGTASSVPCSWLRQSLLDIVFHFVPFYLAD